MERHEREKSAFLRLSEPAQARHQVAMHGIYAEDPWKFLSDCVYTLDQVDAKNPIKLFPSYLDYIKFLTAIWQRERLVAVPKSRRMTCSWAFISMYFWDALFHTGKFHAFVSKKEDDAGDLVSRAEHIYKHIPEWRIPRALLPKIAGGKMTKSPPVLAFEDTNSKIQGMAMGADQLRQFTLSGILGDECAFWPDAQKFYSASKPTLDGGGRMTLISSRSPSFFKKIVFDQLNADDLAFAEDAPSEIKSPMTGVEIWKNPDNGFTVVDLHYTANPAKRSPEWRDAIKKSMPAKDFAMEYEKSWATYEGKPVHGDFNKSFHTVKGKLDIEPGIPLILGADMGMTPAIVVCQLVGRQFRALKEFIEDDGSIKKLLPKFLAWLNLESPDHFNMIDNLVFMWADPAMSKRAEGDDAVTAARTIRTLGIKNLRPGPVSLKARKDPLDNFLIYTDRVGPGFLISQEGCPVSTEGLTGGFQYPEKLLEIEVNNPTPVKNKFSHPCESIQYAAAGAEGFAKSYGKNLNIPRPEYGFQKT